MFFSKFNFVYLTIITTVVNFTILADDDAIQADVVIQTTYPCERILDKDGNNSCVSPCVKDGEDGSYKLNPYALAPGGYMAPGGTYAGDDRISQIEGDPNFSDWCENVKIDKSGWVNPATQKNWNVDAFANNYGKSSADVRDWLNAKHPINYKVGDKFLSCCVGDIISDDCPPITTEIQRLQRLQNLQKKYKGKSGLLTCCAGRILEESEGLLTCCNGVVEEQKHGMSCTKKYRNVLTYAWTFNKVSKRKS